MTSGFLQNLKRPNVKRVRDRLDQTGLALEYFPAFQQDRHDFHSHDFIEILFVMGGRFRHITEDSSFDEKSGGLTILAFNQYHSLRTPDGPVELMNVYLEPEKYPLPFLPSPLADRLTDLFPSHPRLGNRLNGIRHLCLPDPARTAALLNMLYAEQEGEGLGSEAAVRALFELFVIEICRASPAVPQTKANAYQWKMNKVCAYLDEHYAEAVRLDKLCEISAMNPANLCRRFKEHTGLSTGDYLKQKRLAAALQMLRNGDHKILQVGLECGFNDVSRFNRFFKEAFGCTPSAYRNSLRKDAPPADQGK